MLATRIVRPPADPPEKFMMMERALASKEASRRLCLILLADKLPIILGALAVIAMAALGYVR